MTKRELQLVWIGTTEKKNGLSKYQHAQSHLQLLLSEALKINSMCSQVWLKPLSSQPKKWPDEQVSCATECCRANKNSDLAKLQSFSIKVLHLEDLKSDFTLPSQQCAHSLFSRSLLNQSHPPWVAPNKGFEVIRPNSPKMRTPPFSSIESDKSNSPLWFSLASGWRIKWCS